MQQADRVFEGSCHCGAIGYTSRTARDPSAWTVRACQCGFCRAHGAAWVSDAAAQLVLHAHRPGRIRRYRQGSLAAQFLLCGDCGVLVAVVFEDGARTYAAVNARCLQARDAFAAILRDYPRSPLTVQATNFLSYMRERGV